jgi:hypothetical protein
MQKMQHNTKYLSFDFTNIGVDGELRPQCLLCMTILAGDSMRLHMFKRHLATVHAECVGKTPKFFCRTLNDFNTEK